MQRSLLIVFLFICHVSIGQDLSLNNLLTWFERADTQLINTAFQSTDYRLIEEKDTLDLQLKRYTFMKQDLILRTTVTLLIRDSIVEYLSITNNGQNVQRTLSTLLKVNRFRMLSSDVNGDFITTVYDNDRVLLNQDYQAVDSPSGKGHVSSYNYRIYRKYGRFDTMNGEKVVMLTENGTSYIGIRENYKNGVLSGERIFYYPNGTVKRKENYQAGRLNGLVSDYDAGGNLVHSCTHSYNWKYGMEKWYNRQGKVVKIVQWQRDVPVGSEKYFVDGMTIQGISYVNGVKQGQSLAPIQLKWNGRYDETSTGFPEEMDWMNPDLLHGFESVMYQNNLKTGKAVGLGTNRHDTLYIAYYKNGVLDSVYTAYQEKYIELPNFRGNKQLLHYTTSFTNGLEDGVRTYYIPDGPLKDTISRIETYTNGKLNGPVIRHYRYEKEEFLQDPDPGSHVQGSYSGYPKFIPGQWIPDYSLETYTDGVRNGPFAFRQDSRNFNNGTYVNGSLDGLNESGMVIGEKWIKVTRHYNKGIRTGEWITESVFDSIVEVEHYENDRKHGVYTKTVKSSKVEESHYRYDTLYYEEHYEANGDFSSRSSTWIKGGLEEIQILKNRTGDTLSTITNVIGNIPEPYVFHDGIFVFENPEYLKCGSYKNDKLDGIWLIKHKKAEVTEELIYENDSLVSCRYTRLDDQQPYSGTFISAINGERISVKKGLRHGWSTWQNESGSEFYRTKYVKGIIRKGEAIKRSYLSR